ncbi:Serine/threonine protein phosphatase 2A regulatory subunit [Klebsormidium nitens]|uniref:Serine/threonine-protein phosphatase 2A 55 kDa regulatory subunit B n=1 Tax=Klebsormidium nitens TaxID=105231 RepID=A0A1Y1HRX9_KLENI|nr:Serine/threonine protein phosphatase 2A regulatory subunit [Klebsormidium nitens]|eukprot:GAQ80853.1 Serine/threonine protein phosphatase 2A regulatory subunit [Klebsormidium nitens]
MNGSNEAGVASLSGGSAPPPPLEWKFGQVFGERAAGEEVQEVDIISAIEFDKSGDHLATGDRGGRVVLFERVDGGKGVQHRKEAEKTDLPPSRHIEYRYSTEFQSHEPEFDYLKSLEIEEKINKIRWCPTANGSRFLLSTNDKTVKLWKVFEKKVKCVSNFNFEPRNGGVSSAGASPAASPGRTGMGSPAHRKAAPAVKDDWVFPPGGIPQLRLPTVWSNEAVLMARCRRVFANAHAYHINSISNNSDGETYISADDLRINLWNLEVSDQSFNIVDIKPTNMEDLTEVITSAEFHPSHCNVLAYSSSKGAIRLADMRSAALCDKHAKQFEEQEAPGSRSFFSEIIASISDIKFCRDGRYILARDYMTLKLWDVNMESAPVASFKVHEHLRSKLCDLYENDSIFDKFECTLSGDGSRVATGSYSNLFRVFGAAPGSEEASTLEATKTPNRRRAQQNAPARSGSRLANLARGRRDARRGETGSPENPTGTNDFTSKLLHLAWHPSANLIACAASNSLYMYYA